MTNEEAIKILESPGKHITLATFKDGHSEMTYTTDLTKAFEMAIKALEEQESPNSIRINFVGEEEVEEFKQYLENQQEKCRWNEQGMEEWEKLQKEKERQKVRVRNDRVI